MSRIAREKSKSGIYHIMLRGANRQEIFHDEEDCIRFLETLERYKKESGIKVYAWCLMGNHVHLLMQEGKEELATTMKRIGVSFAWFYNWKYKTTGHLFQDRYRSEKIEENEHLLAVARYIHQNPLKAGMVKKPDEWKWSSYQGYYGDGGYSPSFLDDSFILSLFSQDRKKAERAFKEFCEAENDDIFMEDALKPHRTDEEAKFEICKLVHISELPGIKSLPKAQRDEIISRIKSIDGLTQRQLSKILGISLSLINRA